MLAKSSVLKRCAAAALIGVGALILFFTNLARPTKLVFDETHYVPAARALLALTGPANIEHPLLGKTIIAAGIYLFGDNSFGWRFFSAIAGVAVILGVFAIGLLLFGRLRPAIIAAVLAMLNFTVFIQARIAMLDGFMAAFLITGIAALMWAMRGPTIVAPGRLLLAGILLGLATATKWAAAPYVAFTCLAILVVHRRTGWAGLSGLGQFRAVILLGAASVATYFITFAPAFFYQTDPMTPGALLPFQLTMYTQQTQILPPHPYQSSWWTWPLDIRGIWYLFEPVDGAVRGILLVGNPVIMWGGLVAVLACLEGYARDKAVPLLVTAILWIASFSVWIIIPKKIGFFYYYYLPSIFLCLALAAALDHFGKRRLKNLDIAFSAVSLGVFAYFLPIISAEAMPDPQVFVRWLWLPSWA